jgi:hypothetical protein
VAQFRHFGTIENLIQEEIKRDWIRVLLATIQSRTFLLFRLLSRNKNYSIQNYNFACGSVWVWDLVSLTLRKEHVWEQGVEGNIWTEERWSDT